jgi:hypothetical protein
MEVLPFRRRRTLSLPSAIPSFRIPMSESQDLVALRAAEDGLWFPDPFCRRSDALVDPLRGKPMPGHPSALSAYSLITLDDYIMDLSVLLSATQRLRPLRPPGPTRRSLFGRPWRWYFTTGFIGITIPLAVVGGVFAWSKDHNVAAGFGSFAACLAFPNLVVNSISALQQGPILPI